MVVIAAGAMGFFGYRAALDGSLERAATYLAPLVGASSAATSTPDEPVTAGPRVAMPWPR